MVDKEIIETIFGKRNRFDVVKKDGGTFGAPTFWIFRNGERFKGSYRSLSAAIDEANKIARKEG